MRLPGVVEGERRLLGHTRGCHGADATDHLGSTQSAPHAGLPGAPLSCSCKVSSCSIASTGFAQPVRNCPAFRAEAASAPKALFSMTTTSTSRCKAASAQARQTATDSQELTSQALVGARGGCKLHPIINRLSLERLFHGRLPMPSVSDTFDLIVALPMLQPFSMPRHIRGLAGPTERRVGRW